MSTHVEDLVLYMPAALMVQAEYLTGEPLPLSCLMAKAILAIGIVGTINETKVDRSLDGVNDDRKGKGMSDVRSPKWKSWSADHPAGNSRQWWYS